MDKLSIEKVKKDFPILEREVNGKKLVYLDSGATSQKPNQVIDAISDFYKTNNANVHRGIHTLSEEATDMYELARKKVADFISAKTKEIIFTSGTTESINGIAVGWGMKNLKKDDVIFVLESDHHSNIVPWQIVAEKTGSKIEKLQVNEEGKLDLKDFKEKLSGQVKLVVLSHTSNVLGTTFPIKEVSKLAKEAGVLVAVDGAQAVPHIKVSVDGLGCDFYSFSGHKMLGPTGIGVLWARKELLEEMDPFEFGGGMIDEVSVDKSTWAKVPEKFEAGTPNIAGAVGLASAIDYLEGAGMKEIEAHEQELIQYALDKLLEIDDLTILGPLDVKERVGVVSFVVEEIHPHDIASVLAEEGVAVRSGHHCAMPLHKKLDISSSVRASLYLYNTKEDIDELVKGVKKALEILK